MPKIAKVKNLVYKALVDKPSTRSDDFLLILEVLSNYCTEELTLKSVMENHKQLGIPSFASIIRMRRFIQVENPNLVDEKAKAIRETEEGEYYEYAINNKWWKEMLFMRFNALVRMPPYIWRCKS